MYQCRGLIVTIILFFFIFDIQAEGILKVEKGVLDLRGQDLNQLKEVSFTGEWEFYWNKLLVSADFKNSSKDSVSYIHVPSIWTSFELNGEKLPAKGAATYRMLILTDTILPEIAMKVGGIGTAFNLLVNGVELCRAGKVSLNETEAQSGYKPQVVVFTPTNDSIEVIFQVSNYNYSKGGLWLNDYSIGSVDYILNNWNRSIQLSLLLIGSILIFALYHFGLYLLNRNFRYAALRRDARTG